MAKPPSEFVQSLLELMEPLGPVSARRMFGGYGIYRDGLMFGLVADDELVGGLETVTAFSFKVPAETGFNYVDSRGVGTVLEAGVGYGKRFFHGRGRGCGEGWGGNNDARQKTKKVALHRSVYETLKLGCRKMLRVLWCRGGFKDNHQLSVRHRTRLSTLGRIRLRLLPQQRRLGNLGTCPATRRWP